MSVFKNFKEIYKKVRIYFWFTSEVLSIVPWLPRRSRPSPRWTNKGKQEGVRHPATPQPSFRKTFQGLAWQPGGVVSGVLVGNGSAVSL